MGITWEEVEVAAQTDQDGVEVWPNASTWMRVESRSRVNSPRGAPKMKNRTTQDQIRDGTWSGFLTP